MTEQDLTAYGHRNRVESALKALVFCLPLAAAIVTCCISLLSKVTIPIENPVILVFVSFFILVPLRSINIKVLQQITAFYLISVPVNQLSAQYFSLAFLSWDIKVSCSAIPLLLCATGFLIGKFGSANTVGASEKTDLFNVWLLALVIIAVHMILLSVTLDHFYGYGYECNLSTAGNIILYLLLFIVLWSRLSNLRFRQVTGLVVIIFYTASMFINK